MVVCGHIYLGGSMSSRWPLVALVLFISGCGGGAHKPVPVSGKVTLNGKPLADATLMFVPVTGGIGSANPPPSSVGTTGEDGSYELVLNNNAKRKGAVPGKHKVFISLGAKPSTTETKRTFHKQLPTEYNRNSKLEWNVPDNGCTDADFSLKSR
jgi:hypothetical protein